MSPAALSYAVHWFDGHDTGAGPPLVTTTSAPHVTTGGMGFIAIRATLLAPSSQVTSCSMFVRNGDGAERNCTPLPRTSHTVSGGGRLLRDRIARTPVPN